MVPPDFEKIMAQADQTPISADFGRTAQEKLAEAAALFDLTEHGFHDVLSFGIARAPRSSPQFVSHGFLHRRTPGGGHSTVSGND